MTHTVGILGAGTIGRGVGRFYAAAGCSVLLSNSRGPDTLGPAVRELGPQATAVTVSEAAAAETVLLAIPWRAVEATLTTCGPWEGRTLIDATNAIRRYDPPAIELFDFGGRSSSDVVAELAPGARVVKAFNHLPFTQLTAAVHENERRAAFFCGDDQQAKDELREVLGGQRVRRRRPGSLVGGKPLAASRRPARFHRSSRGHELSDGAEQAFRDSECAVLNVSPPDRHRDRRRAHGGLQRPTSG